jgi:putative nucleotidyltransferase with HDIG domain
MALAATRAASRAAVLASEERVQPPPLPGETRPAIGTTRIGLVLGSYRLVTELGQGGMGTVYYAEHVSIGRRAAVKVLDAEVAREPELVQRFFDEARAANQIRHPGIVEVYDVGTLDGLHFLVMELLEGETLGARLERVKKLDVEEAIRVIAQAADALSAAHDRGIVHRDLKPENLFLAHGASGERVKVLDFGIAKLTGKDDLKRTRTGIVMGTPMYMSPEQCMGEKSLDARSDVYSLGVVAFEALTGRTPFTGDGVGKLIVAHTHEPPPMPSSIEPSVPMGVEEIVLKALAKRPSERFATMRELRRSLDAALLPRLPPHLAIVRPKTSAKGGKEPAPPSAEEIERIEAAQSVAVGSRLRDIVHQRLEEDRLPLPAMPAVVMRALELLRDENVGLGRVARVLEADPLAVARVLRLANSAAYGGATNISTVDHAVSRLGARKLRTLLTESAAREVFTSRDPAIARSFRAIWEHCLAVGTLARELSEGASVPRDELYLAGLLHDVGKPVVGVLLLETERSLWGKLGAPAMGGSLWMKIVGECHGEVGAELARRWKLPENVTQAVAGGVEQLASDEASFHTWLVYGHLLAETAGHRAGAAERPEAMVELERARRVVGGTVEREQAALVVLGEQLGASEPASARGPAKATLVTRKK